MTDQARKAGLVAEFTSFETRAARPPVCSCRITKLTTTERARQPAFDEKGAVMVLGMFLALAVIAGIWCIVGIGDALVARDRSQEAADASAFASAVIHARGMNFISLINLVLLAWTMLYVTLCWLDLFLSFALILITGIFHFQYTCALRYLSWFFDVPVNWCAYADKLQKVETTLNKLNETKVFAGLKKVAPPLFQAQVIAATAVPYIGMLSGTEAASNYDRLGIALSLSMIPGGGAPPPANALNQLLDKIKFVQRRLPDKDGKRGTDTASLIQDRRIALPVEAEGAYQLCVRGSRFGLEMTKDLTNSWVFAGRTWKSWLSEEPLSTLLFGAFQSVGEFNRALFCSEKEDGRKEDALPPAPEEPAGGWASTKEQVKAASKALRGPMATADREVLRLALYTLMLGIKGGSNDKFYLKADTFWRANWPNPAVDNGYFAGPKKVSPYAYNGSDWFQVWAYAQDVGSHTDRAGSIVALPSRLFHGASAAAETPHDARFMAQAEYYFDCPTVWQSSQCNKGSAASYQMNWRARLRRVHSLNIVGDLFEVGVNNLVFGTYAKKWSQAFAKKLEKWPTMKTEVGREGWIKAIRNDIAKVSNHKIFTGDRSSHELLH